MDAKPRQIFACSCEATMPLDAQALARGCGEDAEIHLARQLCGLERTRFSAALGGGPVTVGCTFQAPLFQELAEDAGHTGALDFADLRETAGWSAEAAASGPKMAALLAAAAEPMPPIALVPLISTGIALILGRDSVAVEAAERLSAHLDVTVLLLPGAEVPPPRRYTFPVLQGRARGATGALGGFRVTIDGYATPDPSSRARLAFGTARDGAVSTCDLVLDLTGAPALFAAAELRPGYLRADPRVGAAVERAIFEAAQLRGTFDKPRFVDYAADICAHSRSGITGCTRCLDLCPTGAITAAGDGVAINPQICAGCGQCAAACPTGAASYALPPVGALAARLRRLLRAYAAAGGAQAVVLFHDTEHGADLIAAAGRHTAGLPARVLPVAVNETAQIGPEIVAAAIAYGAGSVRLLTRARPRHGTEGMEATRALMTTILDGHGYGPSALDILACDDPEALVAALAAIPPAPEREAAAFLPPDDKRALLTLALRELVRTAPAPAGALPLAPPASFGAVVLDVQACTLCHACVGACPVAALGADADRPLLSFDESRCVQCGLCAATCPEDAITLSPRLDVAQWDAPRVLKQEEPFACVSCGKVFGTAGTVARVRERLAGHWMYSGEAGAARARVLEMCEDCRVETLVGESFDPHDAPARRIRTTADYLRERAERGDPPRSTQD